MASAVEEVDKDLQQILEDTAALIEAAYAAMIVLDHLSTKRSTDASAIAPIVAELKRLLEKEDFVEVVEKFKRDI